VLAEHDRLSLAALLSLDGSVLHDDANGAQHTLHPRAIAVVKSLQTAVSYKDWLQVGREQGLQPGEISELLQFLNGIGGLQVKRGPAGHARLLLFQVRLFCYGRGWPAAVRRWPLSPLAIMQGVTRAGSVLALFVPVTVFLLYGAGMPAGSAFGYAGISFAIFWLSTVIHEGVHAAFVQSRPAAVLQRGLRIGILHKPGPPGRELASALCGPLAGSCAAVVLGVLAGALMPWPYFRTIGLALAAAHLWSLAPWYGDGEILWNK